MKKLLLAALMSSAAMPAYANYLDDIDDAKEATVCWEGVSTQYQTQTNTSNLNASTQTGTQSEQQSNTQSNGVTSTLGGYVEVPNGKTTCMHMGPRLEIFLPQQLATRIQKQEKDVADAVERLSTKNGDVALLARANCAVTRWSKAEYQMALRAYVHWRLHPPVVQHYVDLDKAPAGDYPNTKLLSVGWRYSRALTDCVKAVEATSG
jgi:hypothetical protein